MLLIYTPKITSRLKFVFKQICTRILGIPIDFTTTIEVFIAHSGLKMSYGPQPLGSEFFIKSNGLLFEQGLSDIEINVQNWGDSKCFFYVGEKSHLPFDIFSASFYLLSRYEEYLPHVKDEFGRFTKAYSLAYQHQFLDQPVVDIWAYKFKSELEVHFPDFTFKAKVYRIHPIIDVPMAYFFKNKGLLRSVGGFLSDLYHFRFKLFYERFLVLFGLKKDPFNTFNWIINRQKKSKQKFDVFFLVGDYSTYDKGINLNKREFVAQIKSIRDYCHVGLKTSFLALDDFDKLKQEKRRLDAVINSNSRKARASFSKVNLPTTYRNYVDLEIETDFSMGYPGTIGFRAGTCTPFLFYDLDFEVQTPLMVHPYQLMDFSLLKYNSFLDKKETLLKIIQQVKNVNGVFTPVFHNYTFSGWDRWSDFKTLFNIILDSNKDVSA